MKFKKVKKVLSLVLSFTLLLSLIAGIGVATKVSAAVTIPVRPWESTVATAESAVDHVTSKMIEAEGITDGMHVGQPKEFFEDKDRTAEWYLGQYLSIINSGAWFAMNSMINQSSSWAERMLSSVH